MHTDREPQRSNVPLNRSVAGNSSATGIALPAVTGAFIAQRQVEQEEEQPPLPQPFQLMHMAAEAPPPAIPPLFSLAGGATSLSAPAPVYQRKARINGQEFSRTELYALIRERVQHPILAEVVRYSLIPQLEAKNFLFDNMDVFNGMFNHYQEIMEQHITVLQEGTPADIIRSELNFQMLIPQNPLLGLSLTTCGFEFEFLQSTEDSVLAGLSHIQLALSKETFTPKAIPFKVETDSNCEIELVTPPFMIPTIGINALPHPGLVDSINNGFKASLAELQDVAHKLAPPGRQEREKEEEDEAAERQTGIPGLLKLLSELLGISLRLDYKPISVSNLSYNVSEQAKGAIKTDLSPEALSQITFKAENEKYQGKDIAVAAQINFAASAQLLGKMMLKKAPKEDPVFTALYGEWHRYFLDKAPGLPPDYVEHLLQKLASLYAVPMQAALQEALMELYQTIQQDKDFPDEYTQQLHQLYAANISYVKDVKPVWIKDDLVNITRAYLMNPAVTEIMRDFQISDFRYHALDSPKMKAEQPELWRRLATSYEHDCILAFKMINSLCAGQYERPPTPEVEFLEHTEALVGARQDTYLDVNEGTGATGSDRRYVGELRDGNSDILHYMKETTIREEEQQYEDLYGNAEYLMPLPDEMPDFDYRPLHKFAGINEEEEEEDPMANLHGDQYLLDFGDPAPQPSKKRRHRGDSKEKRRSDKKEKKKEKKDKKKEKTRATKKQKTSNPGNKEDKP